MRWQIALLLCELRLPAAAAAIERARELIGRHGEPPRAQRAARVRGAAGALPGRPRRRRARERRRLRAGAGARRAPHGGVRRVDARHGRAHAREPGRPRSSSSPPPASIVTALVDICALDNCAAALAEARGGRRTRGRGRRRVRAHARDGPGAPARRAQHVPAPRGGARRRARRRPGARGRARRRGADRARGATRSASGPGTRRPARGDVALAAGNADTARAEYEQALALALDVRAEVGPSLPVDARIALSHLRLARVADGRPRRRSTSRARSSTRARAARPP